MISFRAKKLGLSHHLQAFIHPRWCRISSINSVYICMASALGSVNPHDEENSFVTAVAVAHTPVLYVAPLLALGLTLWCQLVMEVDGEAPKKEGGSDYTLEN